MESILSFSISNLTRVPRKIRRSFFAKSFRPDEEKRAGAHRSFSRSFFLRFLPSCFLRVATLPRPGFCGGPSSFLGPLAEKRREEST